MVGEDTLSDIWGKDGNGGFKSICRCQFSEFDVDELQG